MEKYHKQDVAPIEKENERDENYEAVNPQIDSERETIIGLRHISEKLTRSL